MGGTNMAANGTRSARGDLREVEVRVNGEAWTHTQSLLDAGPGDHVYVLNPETGAVTFGDGVNGRKPPVGGGDISVSYRYGDGSSGNIAKRIDAESDLTGFWVVAEAGCQAVGWRKPRR
jgi:hypothetical protein